MVTLKHDATHRPIATQRPLQIRSSFNLYNKFSYCISGLFTFFFFFKYHLSFFFLTESNTRFPLLEVFFLLCALFASDFNITHITGKLAL